MEADHGLNSHLTNLRKCGPNFTSDFFLTKPYTMHFYMKYTEGKSLATIY